METHAENTPLLGRLNTDAGRRRDSSPTVKQLRYLRHLAVAAGESFVAPRTSYQAGQEITRLKSAKLERLDENRDLSFRLVETSHVSVGRLGTELRHDEVGRDAANRVVLAGRTASRGASAQAMEFVQAACDRLGVDIDDLGAIRSDDDAWQQLQLIFDGFYRRR